MTTEFLTKAQKYWTSEKVQKVTGGKKLLITPSTAPELLRVMSLLGNDSSMSADNVRKFRQVNHMLALISQDLEDLSKKHPIVRIVDIGCGNSYLSLLITWFFKEKLQHPIECIGIDANAKLIEASQQRAKQLAYQDLLQFIQGDINDFSWSQLYEKAFSRSAEKAAKRPNVIIGLHACDTASDKALAFGVHSKADFLAVAPCCQAELARAWKSLVDQDLPFAPIFRSHHFRREVAAEMTDVMRMLLMRAHGYEVTATEFVGSEHAMKNRLLSCTRRGASLPEARRQFAELKASLGQSSICLETLLASSAPEPVERV